MKKLIFCVLVLIGSVFAQDQQVGLFNAYELKIFDTSTNSVTKTLPVDLTIQLTDDVLTVIGKSALSWKLSGPIFNSTETSFYSYATDQDGVTCRIWCQIIDSIHYKFGIEYADYSFLYSCIIR